ncbi:hypothetical protein CFP56_022696 [Quercus suber]|uniref:Uncharacterized protein n=1 Tax=Quercus suber TaxID=58331 RepID=A0AAW0KAV7_QUESU
MPFVVSVISSTGFIPQELDVALSLLMSLRATSYYKKPHLHKALNMGFEIWRRKESWQENLRKY